MAETLDLKQCADEFHEKGYVVLRNFFPRDLTAQLLSEVERCAKADVKQAGLSDNGIVYTGAIFLRSKLFQEVLSSQALIDVLKAIAGTGDLWVTMDQAVTKHPGSGIFRWHQDNGYTGLKTQHYQCWIALTETRLENGALQLAPGSHKRGRLPHKYIANGQVEVQSEVGPIDRVDATAGDLIIFSSLMLHATGPNNATDTRVAYVAEYMPLADYAYGMGPPHFVASRGGKSAPAFLSTQPGARNLRNQLMYVRPRLVKLVKNTLRPIKVALTGSPPAPK